MDMRKFESLLVAIFLLVTRASAQYNFGGGGGGGIGNIFAVIWDAILALFGFLFSLILPANYENPAGFAAFMIVFLIFYAGYTIFVNAADSTFAGTAGEINKTVLGLDSNERPSAGALALNNYMIWLSLLTLVMLNVRGKALSLTWMMKNVWLAVALLAIFLTIAIAIGILSGGTTIVLGVFGFGSSAVAKGSDYASSGYTKYRKSAIARKIKDAIGSAGRFEEFLENNGYKTCPDCYHLNDPRGGVGSGYEKSTNYLICENCGWDGNP